MSFQRINKAGNAGMKKKRAKKKPVWDNTVTDLTVHKMSPEEQIRRKQVHKSSNLGAVKKEMADKTHRKVRASSLEDSKSAFIREILYDQTQLSDAIAHTDRVMSVVKDLFADDPQRREAYPNVTLAPQRAKMQDRLNGPVYMRPYSESHLTTLSESIMDQYALNEVTSSSQDSTIEQLSSEDDEEKENVPLKLPPSIVDMDRFQRFLTSQQKHTAQSDIPTLFERGPDSKILSDSGNLRKPKDGVMTPESFDASVDMSGEMLAINDTAKVKKKSQKRIDQELEDQKLTESNKSDIQKVMQGLQQDISAYEKLTGRYTTPVVSDDSLGYTATLLNTIRRLVDNLTQSDQYINEEKNHRIKLQEQLHHQQALLDALTADVMGMKDQLLALTVNPGIRQQLNHSWQHLPSSHEHTQDTQQQNTPPHITKDAKATLPGYTTGGNVENSSNIQRESVTTTLPHKLSQPQVLASEESKNMDTIPSKQLRDLLYIDSLRHVQPETAAVMFSPPRQTDKSALFKTKGMKGLQWNFDKDVIEHEVPQSASDPVWGTRGHTPQETDPSQSITTVHTSGNSKVPVLSNNTRTVGNSCNVKPTIPHSFSAQESRIASAPKHIIYDHGVFPILQTSLAPMPEVTTAQLGINRKLQALSEQHAQARLRLAQLQTNIPGAQGLHAKAQETLVLSPSVSPIPFEVEAQQQNSERHHGQKITVSLPKVEEMEISATSTPSPKTNLSEIIKRQSTSGDRSTQLSSKQQLRKMIHQGSTPLTASRKQGAEEGFFALTAHVDK